MILSKTVQVFNYILSFVYNETNLVFILVVSPVLNRKYRAVNESGLWILFGVIFVKFLAG